MGGLFATFYKITLRIWHFLAFTTPKQQMKERYSNKLENNTENLLNPLVDFFNLCMVLTGYGKISNKENSFESTV